MKGHPMTLADPVSPDLKRHLLLSGAVDSHGFGLLRH